MLVYKFIFPPIKPLLHFADLYVVLFFDMILSPSLPDSLMKVKFHPATTDTPSPAWAEVARLFVRFNNGWHLY